MACIFYDGVIKGDTKGSKGTYENGKLYTAITKVARGNAKTFVAALTFFDESNNSAFRKKLFKLLSDSDKSKFQSADDLNNTAIANGVNINTIVRAIKEYAIETLGYSELANSKTNGQWLYGFNTISAKHTAEKYTADIIKEKYYRALVRGKNYTDKDNKAADNIINKPEYAGLYACQEICKQFYASLRTNEDIMKYKNGIIKQNLDTIINPPSSTGEEAKSIIAKAKSDLYANLESYFNDNKDAKLDKIGQYFVLYKLAYNDINLMLSGNKAEWITEVCNLKSMSKIIEDIKTKAHIKEYEEIDYEDNEEEREDIKEEIENGINTNSWDRTKRSAKDYFAGDVKLYFDTIYKSDTPYIKGSSKVIPHSTDNELGVKETYGSDFVIQQLILYANERNAFVSREAFTRMIEDISSKIKELYGFGTIAQDMRNDGNFMNWIYKELKHLAYTKVTNDIRDIDNPTTRIDNTEFSALQTSINRIRTSIRNTAANLYNEVEYNDILKCLKNISLNVTPAIKSISVNKIVKYISKFIPSINRESLTNFVNSASDNKQNLDLLRTFISDITTYALDIRKALNQVNLNYQIELNKRKGFELDEFTTQEPIKKDYSIVPYDSINSKKSIIDFAREVYNSAIKEGKLTSYNAENAMSSNIGDNNRVGWIIDQLKTIDKHITQGNEGDAKTGLQNLLNEIKTCPQYKRSPFFFGIHNADVNIDGLFGIDANGKYYITDSAQDLIRFHIFDGIKNYINNEGVLWDTMTRGDHFISMLEQYAKPVNTYDYVNGKTYETLTQTRGGYFLCVPADMPKNAIMQYRKFNANDIIVDGVINTKSELFVGLRELLLGELQTMIDTAYALSKNKAKGANKVSEDIVSNSIKDLFKFYAYNGETLIKNGRFTGNVFKFQRLPYVGFDISEELITSLSLYGGGNESLFKVNGEDESITINRVSWIDENTHNIKDDAVIEIFNNVLSKWLDNFRQYISTKNEEFRNAMEDRYNDDFVLGMALNYIMATEVYDSIMIGDTKFYKDSKTIVKRAKEELAGGTVYGSYDIEKGIFDVANLECQDILAEVGIVGGPKLQERTSYKTICVENTIRQSPEYDRIVDDVKQDIKDEKIVERVTDKFKKYTLNDAQSYITFEEWIRRMYACGELNKYKDLIQRIIDAKDENDLNIDDLNAKIQIQKNYYFDLAIDSRMGINLMYPRQIKSAEFVLVGKLLPKGSELRKIYDIMSDEKNDIGQINTVEASKAATRSAVVLWDSNLKYNENWYEDAKKANAIETFYYRNLYRQQVIPQHMVDTVNKFGIQVSKKLVDNVSTASDTVKNAVNEYFKAYQQKIKLTFTEFITSMGWRLINVKDESGDTRQVLKAYHYNKETGKEELTDITKRDYAKFLEQGKYEAQRLGLDSNFIEYWQTDENGETVMPNWFNNVAKKLEQVAQSMFNHNITRQKMPGFHAAVVSDVGWGEKLKYRVVENHSDGSARTVYSEVRAPYWFKRVFKEKLKGKNVDVEKLSDEELLKELHKTGLDTRFWYFMPTEGKQSMAVVRVVGFMPSAYGSTVMAPEEFIVAQGGKDFDGDTIYDIGYNFDTVYETKDNKVVFKRFIKPKINGAVKDSEDNYREEFKSYLEKLGKKVPESNAEFNKLYYPWVQKALQNKILDKMIEILSDASSTEENLMGSQFDDIKKSIDEWDEIRENKSTHIHHIANIYDQIQSRDDAMSGAQLKAISVNRDTLCSLANKGQAVLDNGSEIEILYDANKYNAEKLVKRFGNATVLTINGKQYIKITHKRFGWSTDNKNVDDILLTVNSSETTAHILDALKEGTIYNENKFTFRVFKTIVDVGSNYNTAIGFLSMPGMDALVEAWNEKNSQFVEDNSYIINDALRKVLIKYGIKGITQYTKQADIKKIITNILHYINDNNEEIDLLEYFGGSKVIDLKDIYDARIPLSYDLFKERLTTGFNDIPNGNLAFDILTILTFRNIDTTANNIESIAQCTNPDKFGAKTSIYETRCVIDKVEKAFKPNAKSALKVLDTDNDKYIPFLKGLYGDKSFFPHLKSLYDYSTKASVAINSKMFEMESPQMNIITDTLGTMFNKILSTDEYNRFCRFIVSRLYKNSQLLSLPITIDANGNIAIDIDAINEITKVNINSPVEEEWLRVNGIVEREYPFVPKYYNKPKDFTKKDNESDEEFNARKNEEILQFEKDIERFKKLTPAQKVIMIKQMFNNNTELFNILNAETVNEYTQNEKGYSINKITFTDGVYINDELINHFRNVFNSNNPFVRLAAIDLIKYAFVVEGFNFKPGNISKIVPNDCMLRFSDDGINNIISEIKDAMKLYYEEDSKPVMSLYDDYVRSHSEIIPTIKLKGAVLEEFAKCALPNTGSGKNGIYDALRYFDNVDAPNLYEALGFTSYRKPNYIRISRKVNDKTEYILYKLKYQSYKDSQGNTYISIYMYPLNLLNSNETEGISIDKSNNKFYKNTYYEELILEYNFGKGVYEPNIEEGESIRRLNDLKENNIITPVEYNSFIEFAKDNKFIINHMENGTDKSKTKYISFNDKIADTIKAGKLVDNKYYLMSFWDYSIKSKFYTNVPVVQYINIDGNIVPVKIRKYSYTRKQNEMDITDKYYAWTISVLRGLDVNAGAYNALAREMASLHPVEMSIIDEAVRSYNYGNDNYFELEVLKDEEVANAMKEQLEEIDSLYEDAKLSSSVGIDEIEDDTFENTTVESVGRIIIDDIKRTGIEELNPAATKFSSAMKKLGVTRDSLLSIANNKVDVYKSASVYYKFLYDYISSGLLNFKASDGNNYRLDDKNFYKYLVENRNNDEVQRVIKLLLEAKSFGSAIEPIKNIELTGMDESEPYIKQIIKYITDINSMSNIIDTGIKYMFNIYYANVYANNPLVKYGIIKLNENFSDISILDKWFSDVTELPNKEVQVLTNLVEGIIGEAQRTIAPDRVKKFRDDWKAAGGTDKTDTSHIINEYGKFVQEYTGEFKDKLNKLQENLEIALEKGTTSEEYVYAKLALDEFKAKNTHQKADKAFYKRDVELRKQVLEGAKIEYLKYIKLVDELHNFDNADLSDKEVLIKKWEITKAINNLTSQYEEDGTPKDTIFAERSKLLANYIKENKENRITYFKSSSIGEFNEYVKYYSDIVKRIEKENPKKQFEKLLDIPEYAEARQWLFENAVESIDEGIRGEINKAKSIYYDNNNKYDASVFGKLKREKNRFDSLGVIDGRTFTKSEVAVIKAEYEERYNDNQDKSLIKVIESDDVVYTKEYYEIFAGKLTDEQKEERATLIAQANAILRKGLVDGKLDIATLFNNITQKELETVVKIYSDIKNIKTKKTVTELNTINKETHTKYDGKAFLDWKQYFTDNIKGTKDKEGVEFSEDTFLKFICNTTVNKDGTTMINVHKPNTYLFGIREPVNKEKYIDKDRTKARETIAKYIRKRNTRYYEVEKLKHNKDTKWFDENHIYNPITDEYEPLPIWTETEYGDGTYHYEPKGDFAYSEVISGKEDTKYQANGSYNYDSSTGDYNNSAYTSMTDTEKRLSKLMQDTLREYSFDHSVTSKIKEGFAPRKYKTPNNKADVAKHTASQILKILGLNWSVEPTSYDANIDYSQHRELPFTMLNPLRLKEYKDREEQPIRTEGMSDAEYNAAIREWRKRNEEIDKYNADIEKAYLDKNYRKLFEEFIVKAVEYEGRNNAKNAAFLLLEELKNGKSIKTDKDGNVILRRFRDITDNNEVMKEDNANAVQSIRNWINRVIYTQYREGHKGDALFRLLQSQVSAKYMIANVRGGIANLSTGFANILGESFADYYFSNDDFRKGLHNYNANVLSMIGDSYGLTASSLYSAIVKRFDIVEYDNALKDIQKGKNLDEVLDKFNDTLYICQTGGEHIMQNSTLFAMIKSYRVCDIDGNSNYDIMSEAQFIQEYEHQSLIKAIENYDNGKYTSAYKEYIKSIKDNPNKKKAYDRFKETINQGFLKYVKDKEFTKYYIKTRDEEIKNAKEKFNTFDTIESQLELKDGLCVIKEGSNFTNEMFGKFRREVQSVNNYIHGVYNKDGAAFIEKFAWGSLIMQYRKHIYPGIMKRYRGWIGRGMYNESRRAINKGSYVSFAQFLATEFRNINIDEQDKTALKYIQTICRAFLDTFLNLKLNWNTLDSWERKNMKRCLVDLGYAIGLVILTGMFYAMFDDDDDIKDSNFYSSCLYLLDKCYNEVAMYTPRGLYTEARTAVKNPIAAWNNIEDTTKLVADIWDYVIGADRNLEYKSGQYKGELKPVVYLKKNVPLYRQINAYKHRAKNTSYYRIGDNNINLVIPKQIVYGKEQ